MQTKSQYINLYFTKDDKEILAWANMIRENNLNLGTWIQAILVAENAGEDLNIGTVSIPTIKQPHSQFKSDLLGDDTYSKKTLPKSGWNVRGENGKLIEGSILSIKVTRPVVQKTMSTVKKTHKHLGSYIKVLIRRKLKKNTANTDLLPNKTDIFDLFALCEEKKRTEYPENTHKIEIPPSSAEYKKQPIQKPEISPLFTATPKEQKIPPQKNPLLNYI